MLVLVEVSIIKCQNDRLLWEFFVVFDDVLDVSEGECGDVVLLEEDEKIFEPVG